MTPVHADLVARFRDRGWIVTQLAAGVWCGMPGNLPPPVRTCQPGQTPITAAALGRYLADGFHVVAAQAAGGTSWCARRPGTPGGKPGGKSGAAPPGSAAAGAGPGASPQPPGPVPPVAAQRPDEVVVLLDLTQAVGAEQAIAQQYGLVALDGETNALLPARVQRYRIPDGRTVAAVLAAMQGDARIALAQPNFLYSTLSGPQQGSLAALQFAARSLHLQQAHELARGERVAIAVIDSAVDATHPELVGAVAGAFDAIKDATTAPLPAEHGTAVAGVIAARSRLLGVAPAARLLAVRAFQREATGDVTTTSILLRAIDWANANAAKVYNLSFTGPRDEAVRRVLEAAAGRGAVLVAAAGNGGPAASAAYPAAYPGVLAVTATDAGDRLYDRANRGAYVALAAPGVDILSPLPGAGYGQQSGTSFAAPHVSGVVALMLSRNPGLTAAQIRHMLLSAARDLGPTGPDQQFGAGIVDALAAVSAAAGPAGGGARLPRLEAGTGKPR